MQQELQVLVNLCHQGRTHEHCLGCLVARSFLAHLIRESLLTWTLFNSIVDSMVASIVRFPYASVDHRCFCMQQASGSGSECRLESGLDMFSYTRIKSAC
jgi:hypothetical protein